MLINADALRIPLADRSVHMVVTSPPYWGLRSYDVEDKDKELGLEPTPDEFIANMVAVFREVWRVLRDDGTCWVNMGDSYASQPAGNKTPSGFQQMSSAGQSGALAQMGNRIKPDFDGLKPKDLVGIPWRLAFALQADGWYLRSDIIWAKPNPMPESVTDRPTKSHEYVFLLTKQARYYYDADAVREAQDPNSPFWRTHPQGQNNASRTDRGNDEFGVASNKWLKNLSMGTGRNRRTVWTIATAPYSGAHFATFPPALVEPCIKAGTSERGVCPVCGNPWERVTVRVSLARNELPKTHPNYRPGYYTRKSGGNDEYNNGGGQRILQIATSGWRPTCEHYRTKNKRKRYQQEMHADLVNVARHALDRDYDEIMEFSPRIIEHFERILEYAEYTWDDRVIYSDAPTIPAVVFDPFAGSGTTLLVARQIGRRGVGTDLSYSYLHDQARERLGLAALDAWKGGAEPVEANWQDLPLFGGAE